MQIQSFLSCGKSLQSYTSDVSLSLMCIHKPAQKVPPLSLVTCSYTPRGKPHKLHCRAERAQGRKF